MGGATTAGSPWPRRLGMLVASPRSAIYGTILATAGHEPPGFILAATAATLAVFWLAHVYADILEHELGRAGFDLKVVPAVMARELSMVAATTLSICWVCLACSMRGLRWVLRCGPAWRNLSGGPSKQAAGTDDPGRRCCLAV